MRINGLSYNSAGGSHATENETCDHEVVIILGGMLRDQSQTRDG